MPRVKLAQKRDHTINYGVLVGIITPNKNDIIKHVINMVAIVNIEIK